jgi:hypothetical protein
MMNTTIRHRAHRGVAVAVRIQLWPPGNDLVIFYADDGQTIPQPGLVRLGTIDTGLEVIPAAGTDFELTVEPLD